MEESDKSTNSDLTRVTSLISDINREKVRKWQENSNTNYTSIISILSIIGLRALDNLIFLDSQIKQEINLDLEKYPALDSDI